jgi:hypothetical protein
MNRFRVLKALLVTIAAVIGIGLLGVLAIRLYGAHRLARVTERYEREVGSLSVYGFARKKIPVEQNAVTWQRPGVLAAVFFPDDSSLVGSLSAKRFSAWTAEDTSKLETILARNGPSLELLDRARGIKASNWDIPYQLGTTAKIPNLLAAINAAKMLNARGRLALGRGDRERALASAEALGSLARSHEQESALIVVLIGLVIEKLQLALVNEITSSALATPAELDRLEASLCDEDLTSAVRRSIRSSAAAIAHDVDAQPALGDDHGVIPRSLVSALANVVAAAAVESHGDADRAVGAPIRAPLPTIDPANRKGGWWQHLLASYGANYESVLPRATATASARDLARLAIALRREALVSGSYPAIPPAIHGVPADDPLTGGPRAYVVNGNGSAELGSTTTVEIVRSITPGTQLSYDALYKWALPAPH